ncbi:E3 ubiquitin-protein ligase PRT1-like [Actinidia eriantha]|uniref:E3 ubiquitin-protein ligase PRT1-like n=1 Tax=Actinidia eriantha TaxID=165200 RepID=UPI00258F8D0C|nr:E3 ubiquitin-protein ligase PRT1-like [Actinidia eriantha]
MENQSDGDESEQFSESFICCVCLDLLYKPIVLACGHVSCFWCVRRSMNNQHDSKCPICRHRYHHLLDASLLAFEDVSSCLQEEGKSNSRFNKKKRACLIGGVTVTRSFILELVVILVGCFR